MDRANAGDGGGAPPSALEHAGTALLPGAAGAPGGGATARPSQGGRAARTGAGRITTTEGRSIRPSRMFPHPLLCRLMDKVEIKSGA